MKNKKVRFSNLSCFSQKGFQKRAQVFSLMIVFITLFMCIISSVYIYMIQQENAKSSLISPLTVLQVRDNLTIFEMREKELIENSLKEVDVSFVDIDFPKKFKNIFVAGVMQDEKMKGFIFNDLTLNGKKADNLKFDEESFIGNVLYSKVEKDSGKLKIVRSKIGKSISLSAKNKLKVNFPVDFLFEFGREYLITKKDGKFKVVVA